MNWIALTLLRAYKWLISPLLGPACRYVPSCSEYAMEAVARYGVVRGGLKAAWRLAHCHPLAKGGFDQSPVVSRRSPVVTANIVRTGDVLFIATSFLSSAPSRWRLTTGDWRLAII